MSGRQSLMRLAGQSLLLVAVLAGFGAAEVAGINLNVDRADIERALALSRWPHTDAERVRFHDAYLTTIDVPELRTPIVVQQIEVITEFRRMELIAESHVRLNDSFGRGGIADAVDALRPWHGVVAIDAYLQLPVPDDRIPDTEIALSGIGTRVGRIASPPVIHAKTGSSAAALQGNVIEATFAAAAVGQTIREVRVVVDGRELARTTIDFSRLE